MNRYNNIEKHQAVLTLLTHPGLHKKSNKEIAKRCGVSLDLVNRLRKTVQLSERIAQIQNVISSTNSSSSERIVARTGKSYRMDTLSIGKSKRTFNATVSTEEDSGPAAS